METRDLKKHRLNFKPFEYPEVLTFIDMIHKTFWVHSELDFTADVQDYKVNIDNRYQTIFKRSMLTIGQIEIAVKRFWGDIYLFFPKPEINGMGATFASNEWIHSQAYSHLLTLCGLEDEFEKIFDYPVIKNRIDFANNSLKSGDIFERLLFFVIGIENASLFSQFANILSLTRFKGLMKNIANIIGWTSVDENTHAKAGEFLLRQYITENPNILLTYNQEKVENIVKEFIEKESALLDWIYEDGEVEFFSKEDVLNYMRFRIDNSLSSIGYKKVFNVTPEQLKPMLWFEEEVFSNSLDDFFAKRPTEYTKHSKPITGDNIF